MIFTITLYKSLLFRFNDMTNELKLAFQKLTNKKWKMLYLKILVLGRMINDYTERGVTKSLLFLYSHLSFISILPTYTSTSGLREVPASDYTAWKSLRPRQNSGGVHLEAHIAPRDFPPYRILRDARLFLLLLQVHFKCIP